MAEIGTDIRKAKQILAQGDLVAIPTETVYGLAGTALDDAAVTRIFEVKNRPSFDPLICHVAGLEHVRKYVEDVPEDAQKLAQKFWPGPLTLILKRKPIIPDLVTSGMNTVGFRCPDHALTQNLLSSLDFPLAAPSANPFGYVSPTTAAHVEDQLGDKIPYILDGGPCSVGVESTIIGFEDHKPIVYRLGGLSLEDVESVVGRVEVQPYSTSNPKAPGQLKSHYSPGVAVVIGDLADLLQQYPAHNCGLLSFCTDYNSPYQFILSPAGNLNEAAQNLFSALRFLDKMPIEIILAEEVPDIGIGRAINDRLRRAAAK